MMGLSEKAAAMLRRRALIVLFAAIMGAIGASAVAAEQQTTYSARAVVAVPVFVPSDDDAADPAADETALGRPQDASRLALAYASLILEDLSILQVVSGDTGQPVDELAEVISVENRVDTPILEIVVDGSDAEVVAATMTSFVAALTGPEPATPSIAPDSLQTVRVEEPVASTSTGLLQALVAGLVLGAAIGVVVAIFWERSHPRIDTASEVTTLIGLPARDTRRITDGSGTWVLQRWAELAGESGRVLIVACEPLKLSEVTTVGMELAESLDVTAIDRQQPSLPLAFGDYGDGEIRPGRDLAITVPYPGGNGEDRRILIRAAYPLDNGNGFRPETARPGLVVIAIARGTLADDVVADVDTLTGAGITPGWAVLRG
jgi:capsular polysaccharide biosynthesis protein